MRSLCLREPDQKAVSATISLFNENDGFVPSVLVRSSIKADTNDVALQSAAEETRLSEPVYSVDKVNPAGPWGHRHATNGPQVGPGTAQQRTR
jgi:hypothetical protein